MATVYSTQRTTLTQDDPSGFVKANEMGGEVRVAHGTYEASSLASGDVIEMFALPNGARILQGQLAHDALGSSTTLSVGFAAHSNGSAVSASAAAYKAAAASTSAQIVDIAATLALLNGEEVDANEDGKVVTVTMGGAAGTGSIAVTMLYVVD